MTELDNLFSRVQSVKQKIGKILSLEKDISEKENAESAEIQKIRELASQLQRSGNGNFGGTGDHTVLDEELNDFAEAVNLFDSISQELVKTADSLHEIVEEMQKNSSEELEIIRGLATDSLHIEDSSQAKELAESVNFTHTNTSKILKESKKAKEEAQEAQHELEVLAEMDRVISEIDAGRHDISNPEQKLNSAKERLQDAEWKLGEVPEMISGVEQANEETISVLEQNLPSSRRSVIKGAGGIGLAAITGLAGCSASDPSQGSDESQTRFSVKYGQSRTTTIKGREYVVEAINFSDNHVVIKVNGNVIRVKKGDVLNVPTAGETGVGLAIEKVINQNSRRRVVLDTVPVERANKSLGRDGGAKIHPADGEFTVSSGEEQAFTFVGDEYVVQVVKVAEEGATIRLNNSLRNVSKGEQIPMSPDGRGGIYVQNIYYLGEGKGVVEFSFMNS